MSPATVECEIVDDTAWVVINGAHNRNALSRSVHHRIGECLDLIKNRDDVRFVVLAGSGGIFSSGGDLDELSAGLPEDYVSDYWERMRKTVVAFGEMDQIVISLIEGAAIGAGASLALAADIVLAESTAKMRLSFVHLGFVPDAGATWLFRRNAGLAVARDILLTGRWISMHEARQAGLVSRVVEPGELMDALHQLLQELRQAPRASLARTKALINGPERESMVAAIRAEGETQPILAATEDTAHLIAKVRERAKQHSPEAV